MEMVRNLVKYDAFKKAVYDRGAGGKTATRDWIMHPFFSQKLLVERRQRDRHFKSIVQLTL
jgi:hypothetical protein